MRVCRSFRVYVDRDAVFRFRGSAMPTLRGFVKCDDGSPTTHRFFCLYHSSEAAPIKCVNTVIEDVYFFNNITVLVPFQ